MKKQIYEKSKEDFTEVETKLFKLDLAITMLIMTTNDNPMMQLMAMLRGGQSPVDQALIGRTIFAGTKLLGMKEPTNQEEYSAIETAVEDSPYGFKKFDDLMADEGVDNFLKGHQAEVDEIKNFREPDESEVPDEGDKVKEPQG